MAFELIPLNSEQHTLTYVPKLTTELPFFNLTARHKDIPKVIKYHGRDSAGRPINWEVYQDTSKEIGAPAVEAHEVWYLLVKPSIDSQRLANELGSGLRFCDSRSFAVQVVPNDLRRQLTGVFVVALLPSSRIVPST